MTADRTFRLLVGLAVLAAAAPLVLAYRLLPCAEMAGVALHAVGAACRLLGEAGIANPLPVGIGLAILTILAFAMGAACLSRTIVAARQIDGCLSRCPAPEACTVLACLAARVGSAAQLRLVPSARPRAFCAGLWRPGVFLSTGLLSLLGEQELEAVVRHEEHHVARRDPLRMAVARALAGALFYLPVLRDLEAHFLAAKEVEADRTVVAAMGTRDALASALLALVGQRDPRPAGVAGFDTVSIRIDALASGAYPPLRLSPLRMGLSAMAVLAVVCLLLG